MMNQKYKSEFSGVNGKKDRLEFNMPNQQITEQAVKMGIKTFFQVCAGGLGLIIMHFLPVGYKCKRFIADIDNDKVNLYTCIRDEYFKLLEAINSFIEHINNTYATHLLDRYEDSDDIAASSKNCLSSLGYSNNIIDAVITYFKLIHSQRDTKASIQERIDELNNKIMFIVELNIILQTVGIINIDLMDTIRQYSHKRKCILYVDPPYLLTNGNYAINESEFGFHERLYELLSKCSCKFVLYCRVSASKFSGENANKRLIDDALVSFYDNHYSGKGFYYYDVELKHGNDVTIERMITNLDMSGVEGWKAY